MTPVPNSQRLSDVDLQRTRRSFLLAREQLAANICGGGTSRHTRSAIARQRANGTRLRRPDASDFLSE